MKALNYGWLKMENKIRLILIILIFIVCVFRIHGEEKKEISLMIEIDKTKPVSNIPVKFFIKNISNKNLEVLHLELYTFGIYTIDNALGFPHTQINFNHNIRNQIIKPGQTFTKVIEFKELLYMEKGYNAFIDSDKDFYFRCVISYINKYYDCNKIKFRIN